ncbi:unnamed protein product [Pedinophyceae sp. YPF-701]|nr:unnamed protein product [Pedinophyceae sp. YPF-701]
MEPEDPATRRSRRSKPLVPQRVRSTMQHRSSVGEVTFADEATMRNQVTSRCSLEFAQGGAQPQERIPSQSVLASERFGVPIMPVSQRRSRTVSLRPLAEDSSGGDGPSSPLASMPSVINPFHSGVDSLASPQEGAAGLQYHSLLHAAAEVQSRRHQTELVDAECHPRKSCPGLGISAHEDDDEATESPQEARRNKQSQPLPAGAVPEHQRRTRISMPLKQSSTARGAVAPEFEKLNMRPTVRVTSSKLGNGGSGRGYDPLRGPRTNRSIESDKHTTAHNTPASGARIMGPWVRTSSTSGVVPGPLHEQKDSVLYRSVAEEGPTPSVPLRRSGLCGCFSKSSTVA